MLRTLAKNWWVLALRGLLAILFGLLTVFSPGSALVTRVLLFGAYTLADGIFNVLAYSRAASYHWALLLEGMIGVVAGILTLAWPAMTANVLPYIIAFRAMFTGGIEIIAGVCLQKVIKNEWLLLLMGILSKAFGTFVLFTPGVGVLAIVLWIGLYVLISGVLLLDLAFRLRGDPRLVAQSR